MIATQAQRAAYVPAIVWSPEDTGMLSPWQRAFDRATHLPGVGAGSGVLLDSCGIVRHEGLIFIAFETSDGRYVARYAAEECALHTDDADLLADDASLFIGLMCPVGAGHWSDWADVTPIVA